MRKLIGKGAFTRAYQTGENKVEVETVCPAKECYALFSQGNPFAPEVRHTDRPGVWEMPLYPKIRAPKRQMNARAYEIYRLLKKLADDCQAQTYHDFFSTMEGLFRRGLLSEEEKEHLQDLAGDVCNAIDPRDLRFEVSPRNVTVDGAGNLILLDVFFCSKTLQEVRGRKYSYA